MILTIVTVTLNSEKYLEMCLNSTVKFCSLSDEIEHIVYDGGSTDATCDIANSFAHVKLVENGSKGGVYDAFNKSLVHAKGHYILYLNSDDFLNEKINYSDIIKILSNKKNIWISGHLYWVDKNNNIFKSDNPRRNMSFNKFIISNTIRHPATFIQKEYLMNNLFDTYYKYAADYKFFLDLWSSGVPPLIIPYHVSNFRVWDNSLSSSFRESLNNEYLVRVNWRLTKRYNEFYLLKDLVVFYLRTRLIKIRFNNEFKMNLKQ